MKKRAGFILAGLLGFVCNANAAVITILEDHLTMINSTYSPYGINDIKVYSGPSIGELDIELTAVTEVTDDPTTKGAYSNFTHLTSWKRENGFGMYLHYGTGQPYYGYASTAGYNQIMTDLLLSFEISGDSGRVDMDGWPIGITPWSVLAFNLYDLTDGALYSGGGSYSLLDGHQYLLHYNFFLQNTSDFYPAAHISFENVTVPEPSSLILLSSGLAGFRFTRKFKKS